MQFSRDDASRVEFSLRRTELSKETSRAPSIMHFFTFDCNSPFSMRLKISAYKMRSQIMNSSFYSDAPHHIDCYQES